MTIQEGSRRVREETFRCKRSENTIRGKLYMPEGSSPSPLAICSHGYGYNIQLISLRRLAETGIAACCFDFCGGSPWSRSDGKSTDMSVLTEADDLAAVLDHLRADARIDESRIYLEGNSQGGFVSTLVGIRRQSDVQGLFLMCPAFIISDFKDIYFPTGDVPARYRFGNMALSAKYAEDAGRVPIYEEMKRFEKPVIIYHGTDDGMAPISYSERAARCFPHASLRICQGAGHILEGYGQQMEDEIIGIVTGG